MNILNHMEMVEAARTAENERLEAENRKRAAAAQMFDALESVASSGAWSEIEEHIREAVIDALMAATITH